MDLFDIKLRLEVSRSYSVRDKSTVLNVYIGSGSILPEVTIENQTTPKSLKLSRKSEYTIVN